MIDWTECLPEQTGVDAVGLAKALELVTARGAAAQLCVLRDGLVVLDRTVNCEPGSLFWAFSASKPFVALLVHLLAERGQLSLDDRVADYWPRFGQRGKDGITIRQVLQHRSGVPVARGVLADALAMTDWDRAVRQIERARPVRPVGGPPAYHIISYGFILGEVVRRVSGVGVREFLTTEFLAPLELRDTYLGLPKPLGSSGVPVRIPGSRLRQVYLNRPSTRTAVIPSAGVSTTARDLARFYQMLLDGGQGNDVRVLRAATIQEARRPSSDGEWDQILNLPVRWAQGFQLGGPSSDLARTRAMGRLSTLETFGHNGSSCCIGWADPSRRVAFAYLTNLLQPGRTGAVHQAAVADAILASCD